MNPYYNAVNQQTMFPVAPMFAPMPMVNPLMTWQNATAAAAIDNHEYFNGSSKQLLDASDEGSISNKHARKHWDVPTLDLDGSFNKNQSYIPSAVEKSMPLSSSNGKNSIPRRPNVQPPGGGAHGLFNSSPSTDDLTKKKAKQVEYQKELQRQMESKKEKEAKAKAEYEKYEKKLEAEIRMYDPWGKEG